MDTVVVVVVVVVSRSLSSSSSLCLPPSPWLDSRASLCSFFFPRHFPHLPLHHVLLFISFIFCRSFSRPLSPPNLAVWFVLSPEEILFLSAEKLLSSSPSLVLFITSVLKLHFLLVPSVCRRHFSKFLLRLPGQ